MGQQRWITGRKREEIQQVYTYCLPSPMGEIIPLPPLRMGMLEGLWEEGERPLHES